MPYPSDPLKKFKGAARAAVSADIVNYRYQWFAAHGDKDGFITCEVSGERITIYQSDVDHEPPITFDSIVMNFIDANAIDVSSAPIALTQDGKFGDYFTDSLFEAKWVEYHNARAKLRVISKTANRGIVKTSGQSTNSRNRRLKSGQIGVAPLHSAEPLLNQYEFNSYRIRGDEVQAMHHHSIDHKKPRPRRRTIYKI